MPAPRLGDVVVRSQAGAAEAASFVIVCPVADQLLGGPFESLSEAVNAAHRLIDSDGRIWQEHVDLRGRSLGPPILLPPLRR
jgi:hypothetical protein